MADVLRIATSPASKTQIIYAANLSYSQAAKYTKMLMDCGMISRVEDHGPSEKFIIPDHGQAFLSQISPHYGKIAPGERSVWA